MPIKGPHVIHHDSGTIGRCTQLDGDMIEHTAATIAVSGAASSRPAQQATYHGRLPDRTSHLHALLRDIGPAKARSFALVSPAFAVGCD
jgi:hypothetical protein